MRLGALRDDFVGGVATGGKTAKMPPKDAPEEACGVWMVGAILQQACKVATRLIEHGGNPSCTMVDGRNTAHVFLDEWLERAGGYLNAPATLLSFGSLSCVAEACTASGISLPEVTTWYPALPPLTGLVWEHSGIQHARARSLPPRILSAIAAVLGVLTGGTQALPGPGAAQRDTYFRAPVDCLPRMQLPHSMCEQRQHGIGAKLPKQGVFTAEVSDAEEERLLWPTCAAWAGLCGGQWRSPAAPPVQGDSSATYLFQGGSSFKNSGAAVTSAAIARAHGLLSATPGCVAAVQLPPALRPRGVDEGGQDESGAHARGSHVVHLDAFSWASASAAGGVGGGATARQQGLLDTPQLHRTTSGGDISMFM